MSNRFLFTNNKNIFLILCFSFLRGINFIAPILMLVLNDRGLAIERINFLLATLAISAVILEFPSGILADTFSRKKTLLLSQLFEILTVFLLFSSNFYVLTCSFICKAFSESLVSGTDTALLYEELERVDKVTLFSIFMGRKQFLWALGSAISALAGGYIAKFYINWVILTTLVSAAVTFIFLLLISERDRTTQKNNSQLHYIFTSYISIIWNKKIIFILMCFIILTAGLQVLLNQYIQLLLTNKKLPIEYLGIVKAALFYISSLGFLFSGLFSKKIGGFHCFVISRFFYIACFALSAYFDKYLSVVFYICTAVFWGIERPIESNIINMHIPNEFRAGMNSLFKLLIHLSVAIYAPISNFLLKAVSLQFYFFIACVILLLFLVGLLPFKKYFIINK